MEKADAPSVVWEYMHFLPKARKLVAVVELRCREKPPKKNCFSAEPPRASAA